MALIHVPLDAQQDPFVMTAVRRAFDTIELVGQLNAYGVYRVTGPCINENDVLINPELLSCGNRAVLLIAIGDDEVSNLN